MAEVGQPESEQVANVSLSSQTHSTLRALCKNVFPLVNRILKPRSRKRDKGSRMNMFKVRMSAELVS